MLQQARFTSMKQKSDINQLTPAVNDAFTHVHFTKVHFNGHVDYHGFLRRLKRYVQL